MSFPPNRKKRDSRKRSPAKQRGMKTQHVVICISLIQESKSRKTLIQSTWRIATLSWHLICGYHTWSAFLTRNWYHIAFQTGVGWLRMIQTWLFCLLGNRMQRSACYIPVWTAECLGFEHLGKCDCPVWKHIPYNISYSLYIVPKIHSSWRNHKQHQTNISYIYISNQLISNIISS